MYDRSTIEAMRAIDRPKVRGEYIAKLVNQDGFITYETRTTNGRIVVDGNNPWVELVAGGINTAERFSWSLVCEVLNDPFARPISFGTVVEYEV